MEQLIAEQLHVSRIVLALGNTEKGENIPAFRKLTCLGKGTDIHNKYLSEWTRQKNWDKDKCLNFNTTKQSKEN